MKVYEAIPDYLRQEGVGSVFGLMGDGNMEVMVGIQDRGGIDVYNARHESAAMAMADGYARATDDVGVCTVSCGPGFTHLSTSLAVASRHGTPMVILAGDVATSQKGAGQSLQDIDQRAIALAAGALFHQLRGRDTVGADVQRAFWLARTRRVPVVLNCPMDLQQTDLGGDADYVPSATLIGSAPPFEPDSAALEAAAEALATARLPVIVAGRGARIACAGPAIETLGDRIGAAIATTIQAKGLLDSPWGIGVCGSFASLKAEPILRAADVVVFIGTSASTNVTGDGELFRGARTIQIDTNPNATAGGVPADIRVVGDAKMTVERISDVLSRADHRALGYRDGSYSDILAMDPLEEDIRRVHWDIPQGCIDPRALIAELNQTLPSDSDVVIGIGHFWGFPVPYLHGYSSRRFFYAGDFGSIGTAIPTAFGVAVAQPSRPVIVFDGDASALQNIQELDTTHRYAPHMLIVVMNDGALGAEYHKLRSKGFNPALGAVGGVDFAQVAQAFGNSGHSVRGRPDVRRAVDCFMRDGETHVVDAKVPTTAISRYYRRRYFGFSE
jgi:thiamine pyrophosphate-dependent acetolactate synthase large subunit-like protein